jgi:eukaryotic-like serine/threonine-protein kinase
MSASEKLLGLSLKDGWKVVRKLDRPEEATGGHFSHGYVVEKGTRVGFLKAFDFSRAFIPRAETIDELQKLTAAIAYEREILNHCRDCRMSNVVLAIDDGYVEIPHMGSMEGRVHYLIFEKADGDVRVQVDTRFRHDYLWSMSVAKDVTLGLWQVHKEMIAHQDLKPSNVLVYSNQKFKISDFGRASRRGQPALHDQFIIPGDSTYAPPELIYGYTLPEFNARRLGADLYMLGNLITFLFSGSNLTATILQRLALEHHPDNWSGSYVEVFPYLVRAYQLAINDVTKQIHATVRKDITRIILELTDPDISRRGTPKQRGKSDQYSLERYVSQLDRISKEAQVKARIGRIAA